jgi:plastocyanin
MLKAIVTWLAIAGVSEAATITGNVVLRGLKDHRDAVVYIERIPGKTFEPLSEAVVLDQLNLKFVPKILPILAGTRVTFPNSDEIRHNVFSPGPAEKFNLGTYPSGTARHRIFRTPGEVMLLCNVHAEMSAYILVLETPYFAATDGHGNFTISNVPAGTYQLKTWHERFKSKTLTVHVPETGSIRVEFELQK